MAKFIEEEEETPVEATEGPSSDTEIYTMKSQIGHERTASERLADRARRSGAPIYAILAPSKLRGYIFVETDSPEALRDNLKGLTHARGMVMNKGKGYVIKKNAHEIRRTGITTSCRLSGTFKKSSTGTTNTTPIIIIINRIIIDIYSQNPVATIDFIPS